MKKVFGFVFTILLSVLLLYIFLLSPSRDETSGDERFAKKDFSALLDYACQIAEIEPPRIT